MWPNVSTSNFRNIAEVHQEMKKYVNLSPESHSDSADHILCSLTFSSQEIYSMNEILNYCIYRKAFTTVDGPTEKRYMYELG